MTSLQFQPRDGCPRPISRPGSRPLAADRLGEAARLVLSTVRRWRRRVRERNELTRLDDRMLADIGLTHADRDFLVNKPFWRE